MKNNILQSYKSITLFFAISEAIMDSTGPVDVISDGSTADVTLADSSATLSNTIFSSALNFSTSNCSESFITNVADICLSTVVGGTV